MAFSTDFPKCFVAYPGEPANIAEIMREASENINATNLYEVLTWQDLNIGGNIIITNICDAIDQADFFICDLTHLNPNVLFEMGYAIARGKHIWPVMDTSVEAARKEFLDFGILSTVGYTDFKNTADLVRKFFDADLAGQLSAKKLKPLYDQLLSFPLKNVRNEDRKLFFLKNIHQTEAAVKITRRINKSTLQKVVDDPTEVGKQPFAWYAQNVAESFAVISHFSDKDRSGWRLHNAKQALISGMAHGLQRHLLMIADTPYITPVDYRDLLFVAPTSRQAELHVDSWLKGAEDDYLKDEAAWKKHRERQSSHIGLQRLSVGDPVAENEADALLDYYFPTSAFGEALSSQQAIFIGRKGVGKTATFFKLADEFGRNKENHVCIVKPEGYDFEGLIKVLQATREKAETGFLIESLWKYLIYSELIKSAYDDLMRKPKFYSYSEDEAALNIFCVDHKDIINSDFASRLDIAVTQLAQLNATGSTDKKLHISELLHSKHIGPMKAILCGIFSRTEKVVLLIDNLDSAWVSRPSSELGDLLWGLLSATQFISRDLNQGRRGEDRISLSMVLFLRSDIFHQLSGYAREKDKISFSTLAWDDVEKLVQVLNQRFQNSIPELTPDQVWDRFFCRTIKDAPTKEYLMSHIIPRPRDAIFFVKHAIAEAVNRGHALVEEQDFLSAEKKYSEYALQSLMTEYVAGEIDIEALFYALVGRKGILLRSDLESILVSVGVAPEKREEAIQLLFELSFLGREVQRNDFRFVFERSEMRKYEVMSKLYARTTAEEPRYRVNTPFMACLDISA